MFIIYARPWEGRATASMVVDSCDTVEEAIQLLRQKRARYGRWHFWYEIAE